MDEQDERKTVNTNLKRQRKVFATGFPVISKVSGGGTGCIHQK